MAKLKSLNPKSKTYIIKAFGNSEMQNPVKAVFKSFPKLSETYIAPVSNSIFEGIDFTKADNISVKEEIINTLITAAQNNLRNGIFNFKLFFEERIERFEDFEYGQSKIITVNDFWQVLQDVPQAAEIIAGELYDYAMQKEEFTMGELSA